MIILVLQVEEIDVRDGPMILIECGLHVQWLGAIQINPFFVLAVRYVLIEYSRNDL